MKRSDRSAAVRSVCATCARALPPRARCSFLSSSSSSAPGGYYFTFFCSSTALHAVFRAPPHYNKIIVTVPRPFAARPSCVRRDFFIIFFYFWPLRHVHSSAGPNESLVRPARRVRRACTAGNARVGPHFPPPSHP